MKIKLILLCSLLFTFLVQAKVVVKDVNFVKKGNKGLLTIDYTGNLKDYPELKVVGKTIQVLIPGSKVKRNIEKSYSFASKVKDTQVRVYQTTNSQSKVKTLLPFAIHKHKEKVAITLKDQKIELSFPHIPVTLNAAPKYGTILKKKKALVKRELLNEAYLDKLLKIDPKTNKPNDVLAKKIPGKNKMQPADKVAVTQSSPLRGTTNSNSSISLIEYGGKFVAFLGLVLLLFYGVITLMKKGFIKKGKLGFLNNADQISVIGQNYIAPKKSLMLIKAHNQVFLVSNTEHGIHPISEIRDAAGLLKAGEVSISGTNFDTNLDDAQEEDGLETKVKLKDDITKSNQESSLSSYLNVKDKVKFSDQIKKKVKSLKPLQ